MFELEEVKAHCDVPCGIYDPNRAIISALSVIRMVDLINAKNEMKPDSEAQLQNDISRYISTKEEEAALCKEEIRIIWGDFVKPPHLERFPEIHQIVHNIMVKAGAVKQHVSREKAMDLLDEVNKFAEIFWELKDIKTKRVVAPYPPAEEIVIPVL